MLIELAKDDVVPGIAEFLVQSRFLRALWFFGYTASLCLGITVVSMAVSEFLGEPTSTETSIAVTVDSFPPIAVCPHEWYDLERLESLGLMHLKPFLEMGQGLDWNMFWNELEKNNISSMSSLMQTVALPPEQHFHQNYFMQLRMKPRLHVKHSGVCSLLDFQLQGYEYDDLRYPDLMLYQKKSNFFLQLGFRALSRWRDPDFQIMPGLTTIIHIKVTWFHMISTKRRKCLKKEERSYDQRHGLCKARCQNKALKNCWKCANESSIPGDPDCLVCQRFLGDATDPKGVFYSSGSVTTCSRLTAKGAAPIEGCVQLAVTECLSCKQACSQQKIDTTVTYREAVTGTEAFRLYLVNDKDSTMITEFRSYSVASLLSNIGGLVGICSGMSIITILQIFFFCCKRANAKRQKNAKKSEMV